MVWYGMVGQGRKCYGMVGLGGVIKAFLYEINVVRKGNHFSTPRHTRGIKPHQTPEVRLQSGVISWSDPLRIVPSPAVGFLVGLKRQF